MAKQETQQFTATVAGLGSQNVIWSVDPITAGSISPSGLYTAPSIAGTYYVVVTSVIDPKVNARAKVTVVESGTSSQYQYYEGTITISNQGVKGGESINQTATLDVVLMPQGNDEYSNYDNNHPTICTASVNDTYEKAEPLPGR